MGIRSAAPIMFGDATESGPLVGTSPDFFSRNSEVQITEGRVFRAANEAVVGYRSPAAIGTKVRPIHGDANDPKGATPHGFEFVVVGRARSTGTRWDFATLVPIATLDKIHFHDVSEPQVIAVSAQNVADAYRLRHTFRKAGLVAAFPAELLVELDAILDVPRTIIKIAIQALQALLLGVAILFLVRIAFELRPQADTALHDGTIENRNFVFRQYWIASFATIATSITVGLALGELALPLLAGLASDWLGVTLNGHLSAQELQSAASQLGIAAAACIIPAFAGMLQRQSR